MNTTTETTRLQTTRDLLDLRADDHRPGLLFEGRIWTWAEVVAECRIRANLLLALHEEGRPFHVGVMLENDPEYIFAIGAAAYAGAAVVGINLTRRGEELARDIRYTDCEILITNAELEAYFNGVPSGVEECKTLRIATPQYAEQLAEYRRFPAPDVEAAGDPRTILLLLFTSGSTGDPKAVICTTGRLYRTAAFRHMGLGSDDVSYNSMPLFHGNGIFACWANPLYTGGAFALARKFSASGFLPDVMRYKATYFNYVGRSLSYLLAQPEKPQERQTKLESCFGTEASELDMVEFARRFGIWPTENYGASEGGLTLRRTPETPAGSLGLPPEGMDAAVVDPQTMTECPRAVLSDTGRILNAEEAIGELVNLTGAPLFEGYYKNPEAVAERIRGNAFLTGDLAYRDEKGFFYFAGRTSDKLRVDSENFSAAPVERVLSRYPGVMLAAVYPVPDARTGDQVMATLQMEDPDGFDPASFAAFLEAQPDLGTKWAPRFLSVVKEVPVTATQKISKPTLRKSAWLVNETVYHRPGRGITFERLDQQAMEELEALFEQNGRAHLLPLRPASSNTKEKETV
ncbi:AMP-binding protein [Arthrobacter sp. BL-252-APC-1A]|uniref:AMP-binding protein n=1 Tax=Arthrobacter sp. BL-252-APC-1A TaxID=2606622 RepID=UPI0012B3C402|nr:AMP-binding protein [Arthrobacter sp. BL-252-APC-1A]MSR97804.1 AMP-binding protein [Arthrobacter sp. BL-252-APC-1A]